MPYVLHDLEATTDYSYDWSDYLDEAGSPSDTLSTSAWTIEPENPGSPSEPILSGDQISGNIASVFVSNLLAGQIYRLSNRVVTAQGRTEIWSITLRGGRR
jgi:hypothetical protein